MFELLKIDSEYLSKHPGAQSLFDFVAVYSFDELIKIYNEAKGRKIVFELIPGVDNYSYRYE